MVSFVLPSSIRPGRLSHNHASSIWCGFDNTLPFDNLLARDICGHLEAIQVSSGQRRREQDHPIVGCPVNFNAHSRPSEHHDVVFMCFTSSPGEFSAFPECSFDFTADQTASACIKGVFSHTPKHHARAARTGRSTPLSSIGRRCGRIFDESTLSVAPETDRPLSCLCRL